MEGSQGGGCPKWRDHIGRDQSRAAPLHRTTSKTVISDEAPLPKGSAMNITEFLEARIAEDEARARYPYLASSPDPLFSPARILAECAAKRAIVGWWTEGVIGYVRVNGELTNPLLPLAAVYANHPDYRQEWAK
jgi:hypothetical protein